MPLLVHSFDSRRICIRTRREFERALGAHRSRERRLTPRSENSTLKNGSEF